MGGRSKGENAEITNKKQPKLIARSPLSGEKDELDNRTVGGVSASSLDANRSAVDCTTSWDVGDIVELLHDAFSEAVTCSGCVFGHVIGVDQSGAGVRGVRVRQLLTAAQVPAVLRRTCICVSCPPVINNEFPSLVSSLAVFMLYLVESDPRPKPRARMALCCSLRHATSAGGA